MAQCDFYIRMDFARITRHVLNMLGERLYSAEFFAEAYVAFGEFFAVIRGHAEELICRRWTAPLLLECKQRSLLF
jgi:hypothetical protein